MKKNGKGKGKYRREEGTLRGLTFFLKSRGVRTRDGVPIELITDQFDGGNEVDFEHLRNV